MPPRENPTARQVRLGIELRKLRERAGRTAREAAGMLSVDQAKISHLEAGRIGVSEERVRRLCTFYQCSDDVLISALCAITKEHRGQFWWDEYRGVLAPAFLDIAELEHHGVDFRSFQSLTLPGIFQTESYARALFSGMTVQLSPAEIETRVEHRMRRFQIFDRPSPPPFAAVIHEAALRMRFGGRKVVRGQLERILELSHAPTITFRVVPYTNEEYVEVTHAILYAGGVVPQLDAVWLDGMLGGNALSAEAVLESLSGVIDSAERASLDPEESRLLIHHIAREL